MPSAAKIQSVPPPVGALPPPIKSSDGRYKVFLSAPRMDHPYPAHGWQTNVRSATRFDRPIAEAAPWSILLQFLTAMRVHSSEAIDRWTELTSEAEAKLCQQLFAYIQFEDNWDGDGGRVPSLAAANNALWFLANRPADIPLPSPECGTEGDIGLYWGKQKCTSIRRSRVRGGRHLPLISLSTEAQELLSKNAAAKR